MFSNDCSFLIEQEFTFIEKVQIITLQHQQFVRGLRNGYHRRWYPCGKKFIYRTYKNDMLDGKQREWWLTGQKKCECEFKNGVLIRQINYN